MYSNDQTQIRAGMVNYIGALIKSSSFEGRAAKQSVVAVLIEEALKLAKSEDQTVDLYVLKPMIRGMVFTLNQRVKELSKLPKNQESDSLINEYKTIISTFDKLLDVL
jgi:hypothetical protein